MFIFYPPLHVFFFIAAVPAIAAAIITASIMDDDVNGVAGDGAEVSDGTIMPPTGALPAAPNTAPVKSVRLGVVAAFIIAQI